MESFRLSNVANSILAEYSQAQLSESSVIAEGREIALVMRPAPHSSRLDSLNQRAVALVAKYIQGRQTKDLDEAICLGFEAYQLTMGPNKPYALVRLYTCSASLSSLT